MYHGAKNSNRISKKDLIFVAFCAIMKGKNDASEVQHERAEKFSRQRAIYSP